MSPSLLISLETSKQQYSDIYLSDKSPTTSAIYHARWTFFVLFSASHFFLFSTHVTIGKESHPWKPLKPAFFELDDCRLIMSNVRHWTFRGLYILHQQVTILAQIAPEIVRLFKTLETWVFFQRMENVSRIKNSIFSATAKSAKFAV